MTCDELIEKIVWMHHSNGLPPHLEIKFWPRVGGKGCFDVFYGDTALSKSCDTLLEALQRAHAFCLMPNYVTERKEAISKSREYVAPLEREYRD